MAESGGKPEKNQILALIEEGKQSLAKAQADFVSAKAQEDLAYKDIARYEELVKTRTVAQSEYDRVRSQWQVALAATNAALAGISKEEAGVQSLEAQLKTQQMKIAEAKAALGLAKINLQRTLVKAPSTGRIANKNVDPGKYVQPGQPVLSLANVKGVWVVANFKETQIIKMRVGQPVDIEVDAYPGSVFKGHIDGFQPGAMLQNGADAVTAQFRALALLNQEVQRQAMMISFNRVFFLVAVMFVFTMPLVLALRRGDSGKGHQPVSD